MPPKPDPASAPRSRALLRWIDTSAGDGSPDPARDDRIDWLRALPFVGLHLACLGVFWVGVSATALWVALALYALRMFAITGFYHRYFSHKAFRTSRALQFVFAVLGAVLMAIQVGYAAAEIGQPIWLTVAWPVYGSLGTSFGLLAGSNVTRDKTPPATDTSTQTTF